MHEHSNCRIQVHNDIETRIQVPHLSVSVTDSPAVFIILFLNFYSTSQRSRDVAQDGAQQPMFDIAAQVHM